MLKGANFDIESFIKNCDIFDQEEILINYKIPQRPSHYTFSEYFKFEKKSYLILIDSYSIWLEVTQTKTKNVDTVIVFYDQSFLFYFMQIIFL